MVSVSRGLFAVLLLASVGCGGGGSSKPKLYPVSGKVMVDGKAPANCTIQFVPTAGKEGFFYSGRIGADGGYSLSDPQDQHAGAAPGKYKVILQQSPEGQKAAMMSGMKGPSTGEGAPFPAAYSQPETSPKEVEVKAESNTIDLTIP